MVHVCRSPSFFDCLYLIVVPEVNLNRGFVYMQLCVCGSSLPAGFTIPKANPFGSCKTPTHTHTHTLVYQQSLRGLYIEFHSFFHSILPFPRQDKIIPNCNLNLTSNHALFLNPRPYLEI